MRGNQMKCLVLTIMVACGLGAFAIDTKVQRTPEEKAAMKQRLLERTGGMVYKAGEGKVVYVNCQKKFPTEHIRERVKAFSKTIRVNFEVVEGGVSMYKVPAGANAAIYIVDDPALPMSLIAVERNWGLMNVSDLGENGQRFDREFVRVSILTLGAGASQFKGNPMGTVNSPADLDKIRSDNITFDSVQSVTRNLKAIGVTESRLSSYRKACMDGWAPDPTNDFQKAVWEEVHAKPTKPMKIKFDPKKGE